MAIVKNILLDMDGVIADFLPSALDRLDIHPDRWDPGKWNVVKGLGLTTHEFFAPMDVEFWATLPKTPWFDQLMLAIEVFFPEAEVYVATAPPGMEETNLQNIAGCITGKLMWIKRHLPDIAAKNSYSISRYKNLMANESSLLIDDADHNVDKYRKSGGPAVLIPSIGNSIHEQVPDFRENPEKWLTRTFLPYSG